MPLPSNNTRWPPQGWEKIYDEYEENAAWYSGDPQRISDYYSRKAYSPTTKGEFWAQELKDERKVMVHIPLAGDVAATSADLLFGEAPKFKIPEAHQDKADPEAKKTQDRIEDIVNGTMIHNRLLEAADACAGIGGILLKVNWDTNISPYPLLDIAQADASVPEFTFGILRAVTLWKLLEDDGKGNLWRLVERHENGLILNGLYRGRYDNLGTQVDLSYRPDTAGLQPVIHTGAQGLAVRYIPNMKPNRRHRGSALGQSDYAGSYGLLDSLDEVYTSWLRDIRLAKARIMVPESFLDRRSDPTSQNGYKFGFDMEQEVFTPLEMDPMSAANAGITLSQFAIRTEEHKTTALELIDRIVTKAGYSPQTFGLNIDGKAESGTALNVRERKSFITRSKKQAYWKAAIEDLIEVMQIIDNQHLGQRYTPFRPNVEMQDSITNDLMQTAQAVELLNRAQAVSVDTKVRLAHPDWDNDQVKAEVDMILKEQGLAAPNPDEILG